MKQIARLVVNGLLVVCLGSVSSSFVYAAPPEGKGKPDNPGQQGQGQGQGQDNGRGQSENARAETPARGQSDEAPVRGNSDEARTQAASTAAETRADRQHPHQERRAQTAADRADKAGDHLHLASAYGRGEAHGLRGFDAAKAHVDSLLKSLNKLEKGREGKAQGKANAKWDSNPRDTRGQGNMGKVDMRSPYGFDKDSDREGAERGRAIHIREPEILDLASLLSLTWGITDMWVMYYQNLINWFNALSPTSPYYTYYYTYYSRYLSAWQEGITYHLDKSYTEVVVNWPGQTIDYTLSLGNVPSSFEGDALVVTFNLTSLKAYDGTIWTSSTFWNGRSWQTTWTQTPIHYDAGQTVVSQTQEVTLTDSGTYTLSYDPPDDSLVSTFGASGVGNWFEASVTVTDPASGSSITYTFDESLYIWRCPYGIVYDKATGKPIPGATVAIHTADGSIAVLDKGANPNVSNPQKTDATGRYNAKLAIGKKYYLTVTAPGYAEYKSSLFSERWHIVREDVGLIRANSEAAVSSSPSLPIPAEMQGDMRGATSFMPGVIPGKSAN